MEAAARSALYDYLDAPSTLLLVLAGVMAALVVYAPWALLSLNLVPSSAGETMLYTLYALYLLPGLAASAALIRYTELHCTGKSWCRPLSRSLLAAAVVPPGYALVIYAFLSWLNAHGRLEREELKRVDPALAGMLEPPRPSVLDPLLAVVTLCLHCALYPFIASRVLGVHLEAHYAIEAKRRLEEAAGGGAP